jgi:hypothetical protein
MIQKKSTFFIGLFIFLVPFLGLPSFWKTVLIVLASITLMALSIRFPVVLPKKPQVVKAVRVRKPKAVPTPIDPSNQNESVSENFNQPPPII